MIPTGVPMVVSGGAVSPENRSNEEREAIRQRSQRLHATGTGNALAVADDVRSLLDSLAAVERERDEAVERAEQQRGGKIGYFAAATQAITERDAAVAENARLLARIAAVEAAEAEIRAEASEREPEWHSPAIVEDARALALRWACKTIRAALAASPTPTGPEPTTRMSRDEAVRSVIPADVLRNLDNPLRKHRHCPGPATPEPTKETP